MNIFIKNENCQNLSNHWQVAGHPNQHLNYKTVYMLILNKLIQTYQNAGSKLVLIYSEW